MGYGAKRLMEIAAEKEAKKKERERIKQEKEKEKKRLKKIEHKKKLRQKQNRRAYLKRRKVILDERKAKGDEYGYFSVYITKNNKKVRFLGTSWWKLDAYKIFNDAVEGNHKKVLFPQTVYTNRKGRVHEALPIKYEILLVKKIMKEGEETVASFRDENGKFVDNIIVDWKDHVILDKADWYVEEKFGIYGYHPRKDKKTYSFILNELLLNNEDTGDNMRRIMVYNNKLIIQYLEDFDFVKCYDNEQCKTLYDKLQRDITSLKKKYIVFMGEVVPEFVSTWIDRFEEKTGWKRNVVFHGMTK